MPLRATDEGYLEEMKANALYVARREQLPKINGVFIGTECDRMYLVPVPIRPADGVRPRAMDAVYRIYVRVWIADAVLVFNQDQVMTVVDRYPTNSTVAGPSYIVFTSNHPLERPNKLLNSFTGAESLLVKGNILVVKNDVGGEACRITASELYFIERLVVDTLVTQGVAPNFPKRETPVVPFVPLPDEQAYTVQVEDFSDEIDDISEGLSLGYDSGEEDMDSEDL